MPFCPNCGTQIEATDAFCTKCGFNLRAETYGAPQPPAPPQPYAQPPPPPPIPPTPPQQPTTEIPPPMPRYQPPPALASDFAQYLVSNEDVVYAAEPITVSGEGGYKGAVTKRRLIFLKGRKIHEFTGSSISSMTWKSSRRKGLLIGGVILLILGIAAFGLLGGVPIIPGVILIVLWYRSRKETLVVYGAGRQLYLNGPKNYLEKIMVNVRNELLK